MKIGNIKPLPRWSRCDRAGVRPTRTTSTSMWKWRNGTFLHSVHRSLSLLRNKQFPQVSRSKALSLSASRVPSRFVATLVSLRLQPGVWPVRRSIIRFLLRCRHALRLQCATTERDGLRCLAQRVEARRIRSLNLKTHRQIFGLGWLAQSVLLSCKRHSCVTTPNTAHPDSTEDGGGTADSPPHRSARLPLSVPVGLNYEVQASRGCPSFRSCHHENARRCLESCCSCLFGEVEVDVGSSNHRHRTRGFHFNAGQQVICIPALKFQVRPLREYRSGWP